MIYNRATRNKANLGLANLAFLYGIRSYLYNSSFDITFQKSPTLQLTPVHLLMGILIPWFL
jgi:hypothetical protein